MDYRYIVDLLVECKLPEKGILSNVIHKDEEANITLFGFSAGQELSAHSAPTPAILYFLEGEADVQLGEDTVHTAAGSFVFMPPMLSHAIRANTPIKVLLVQLKPRPLGP